MSYCPQCGRRITNDFLGCSYCGYKSIIDGEIVSETTEPQERKDENPYTPSRDAGGYDENKIEEQPKVEYKKFNNKKKPNNSGDMADITTLTKVLVFLLIFIVQGVGPVLGIFIGAIYMGRNNESYRSFGKTVMIISILFVILYMIFCCISGFSFAAFPHIMDV